LHDPDRPVSQFRSELPAPLPGAADPPTVDPRAGKRADQPMRPRDYLFLILLCLVVFLPGLSVMPPLDRDEPRFAEASRQMLESGDFVDIRFQNEPRLKKPVGIYWLQAASAALFSSPGDRHIWPYRLPSTLGATLAVLLTAAIGAQLFGRAAGWTAAFLMATSLLLGVEARLAKTDAVQLATVCAAQLALARAYLQRERPAGHAGPILFWGAVGLGILVKGPIIVMVSGFTALGLALLEHEAGWLKRLKPWPYALLAPLIVLPWGIAIMLQTKGAFLTEAVGHDLLGKVAGAQEAHGAPPGFFLVTFWATFWPGSLLAGLALPWVWRHRREPAVRFCLAWLVPSWIVFELVPTKLPHYTLPLFPAIALLAAQAALQPFPVPAARRGRIAQGALVAGWLVLTLGLCAGLALAFGVVEHRIDIPTLLIGVAAMLLFLAAFHLYRSGRRPQALGSVLAACLLFYGTAYGWVAPRLEPLWVSTRAAAAVAQAKRCADTVVTSAGYSEPSLVFLLGPATRFGDGAAAAQALLSDRCALALVDKPFVEAFTARLARDGRQARPLATIDGLNLARGKRVALTLYAATPPAGGS
jgi:4-amino-4-deoxy-L-arabinose transferase-like glycosyltransferase